jgi:L-phenylalanine/L-methionine N-acetyltransferase
MMNPADKPTAIAERRDVALRRATREDAARIAELCTTFSVYDSYMSMPFGHRDLWVELCTGTWDLPLVLLAENVADGRLLGFGTLFANGKNRRQSHLGLVSVAVAEDAQGQGVGAALLGRLLSVAEPYYQFSRLEAYIWTQNAASLRLFQSNGFVIEGTMNAWASGPGGYYDVHVCARLSPTLRPAPAAKSPGL